MRRHQSDPRPGTYGTLLLLLLLLAALVSSRARGQQQEQQPKAQPAYLIASLSTSNPGNHSYATLHELLQPASLAQYSRIELLEDYHLKPALYNVQAPLRLAGNVTITSANYSSDGYRVLYTEFKESAVLIPSGVSVVFRDIALGRARKTSGQGIPLFVGEDERSLLRLDNVVRIRTSCAPEPSQLVASLNSGAAAAAAGAAGNSSAAGGASSNSSGSRAASLVDFAFRGRVFPDSVHAINVSSMVTPGDVSDVTYFSGYMINQRNTTRVCLSYVDPACMAAQGADACILAAINLGLAEEAAAATEQPAGPHVPVAAIAVPAAVGGVLLLSVAVLGLFLLSRRRSSQQQQPKSRQHQQLLPRTGTGGSSQAALRQQSHHHHHHHHHHHPRPDGAVIISAGAAGSGDQSGSFDGSDGEGGGADDTRHSDPSNIPGSVVSGAVGTIEKLALSNRGSGWMLVACHTSPEFSDATPKDRIKLGVLLGAGSFGRVYKGSWRRMTVAVKVLTHDSTTAAAISNEVDLVMSFRHPNIVAAYHFVTWRQVGRQSVSDQQLLPASSQVQQQEQQQQQQQQQLVHKARATGLPTVTECTFGTFGSSLPSASITSRQSLDGFPKPPGVEFVPSRSPGSAMSTAGAAAAAALQLAAGGPHAALGSASAGAGAAAWGGDPRAVERSGTGGSSNSSSSNVSAVLTAGGSQSWLLRAGSLTSGSAAPGTAAGAAASAAAAAAAVPPSTPRAAAAAAAGKGGDHVALSIVPFSPQQQLERRSGSRLLPRPPGAAAGAAAAGDPAAASPFAAAAVLQPFGSSSASPGGGSRGMGAAASPAAAAPPSSSLGTGSLSSARSAASSAGAAATAAAMQKLLSAHSPASNAAAAAATAPGAASQSSSLQPDISGLSTSPGATSKHVQPGPLPRLEERQQADDGTGSSVATFQLIPFTPAQLNEALDRERRSSLSAGSASLSAALPDRFEFEHASDANAAGAAATTSGAGTGCAAGSSGAAGGSAPGGSGAGTSSTSSALMTGRPRLATLRQQGDPFESQTWLIFEYCDGGTLLDLLLEGRLAATGNKSGVPAHILTLLLDICSGMAYLHARNVLHGDLKPGNVLIKAQAGAPYGRVAKVADFGLSRALQVGQTHRSTRTMGTMNHAPPELLRLGRLSPAGDVYAFGVLMWECFSGQMAFSGLHYGELFEQVALHQLRPPVPEGMPADYAALMAECWAADPFARPGFASVQARLSAMLEPLAQADAHLRYIGDL